MRSPSNSPTTIPADRRSNDGSMPPRRNLRRAHQRRSTHILAEGPERDATIAYYLDKKVHIASGYKDFRRHATSTRVTEENYREIGGSEPQSRFWRLRGGIDARE